MFMGCVDKNEIFLLSEEASDRARVMWTRSSGAIFIAALAERDLDRPNPKNRIAFYSATTPTVSGFSP
jgi:hypothetical protein